MQLYPQFTREYILNKLTLEDAIVFYNEGIRIKQQLAGIEAFNLFGVPQSSGGDSITGDVEIRADMDGESIIKAYQARQFNLDSFSDLILGGGP